MKGQTMIVKIDGKTLYHIQNMNICSDGSVYDMFLLSDHKPTADDLKKAFMEDYGDETLAEEFATGSEVYEVYYDVL